MKCKIFGIFFSREIATALLKRVKTGNFGSKLIAVRFFEGLRYMYFKTDISLSKDYSMIIFSKWIGKGMINSRLWWCHVCQSSSSISMTMTGISILFWSAPILSSLKIQKYALKWSLFGTFWTFSRTFVEFSLVLVLCIPIPVVPPAVGDNLRTISMVQCKGWWNFTPSPRVEELDHFL